MANPPTSLNSRAWMNHPSISDVWVVAEAMNASGDPGGADQLLTDNHSEKHIATMATRLANMLTRIDLPSIRKNHRLDRLVYRVGEAKRTYNTSRDDCVLGLFQVLEMLGASATDGRSVFTREFPPTSAPSWLRDDSVLSMFNAITTDTREKICDTPLDTPQRHTIVHGRAMDFSAPIVSAKLWSIVLGIGFKFIEYHGVYSASPPDVSRERPETDPQQWFDGVMERLSKRGLKAIRNVNISTLRHEFDRPMNLGVSIARSTLVADNGNSVVMRVEYQYPEISDIIAVDIRMISVLGPNGPEWRFPLFQILPILEYS